MPTQIKVSWYPSGPELYQVEVRLDGNVTEKSGVVRKDKVLSIIQEQQRKVPDHLIEVSPAMFMG